MKKTVACLALLCTIYSCKKSKQTPVSVNITPLTPAKITVSGPALLANSATSQGSATYNLLGYGFDVTGKYADTSAVRSPAIDIAAFDINNPDRLNIDLSGAATFHVINAANAQDYSLQISRSLVETSGFNDFQGTIVSSFSSPDAFLKKYVYGSYSVIIQQKRLSLNGRNDLLIKYLTSQFNKDIQKLSSADLVKKYGTHVLCDIILGARFNVIYQGATSIPYPLSAENAGFTYALKNVFGLFSGSLDPIDSGYLAAITSPKIVYNAVGGDLTKLKEVKTADRTTINITDWHLSSTMDNSVFIDISNKGLIPLSDLIADPAKSADVKAYIATYLANNQVKLMN